MLFTYRHLKLEKISKVSPKPGQLQQETVDLTEAKGIMNLKTSASPSNVSSRPIMETQQKTQ